MLTLIRELLKTLAVTLLLEEAVALAFCVLKRRQPGNCLLACLLGNLLTNPTLNVLLLLILSERSRIWNAIWLILLELCAWAAEMRIYGQLADLIRKERIELSIVANMVSLVAGSLLLR